jgi:hypothetical protein
MKAQMLLALLFAATLAPAAVADKPAAPVTLEGSPATDGSGSISPSDSSWVSEVLFGGVTPPHGFQVQIQEAIGCPLYVSDVGPMPGSPASGFLIALAPDTSVAAAPTIYTTPPGYKPIGPVYVGAGPGCGVGASIIFAARMW